MALRRLRALFVAAAVSCIILPSAPAQTAPAPTKNAPAKTGRRAAPPGRTGGTATPPASTPTAPKAAPAKAATPAPAPPKPAEEAAPAEEGEKDAIGSIVSFIVGNVVWIVLAVAIGIGVLIWLAVRGGKKEEGEAEEHRPLPIPHKPPDEDDGPRRVLVTPGAAPAQAKAKVPDDEKDYALVVKEEDIAMPPVPEEVGPRKKVDAAPIEELISRRDFDEAYKQYVHGIGADTRAEVSAAVERRLGDHFLEKGDLEKAARILEHHVATHGSEEIEPVTYFNLGYLYFRTKTLTKSRRYFRMFVERHKDPVQVDRARKLLQRLDKVQNLN